MTTSFVDAIVDIDDVNDVWCQMWNGEAFSEHCRCIYLLDTMKDDGKNKMKINWLKLFAWMFYFILCQMCYDGVLVMRQTKTWDKNKNRKCWRYQIWMWFLIGSAWLMIHEHIIWFWSICHHFWSSGTFSIFWHLPIIWARQLWKTASHIIYAAWCSSIMS